MKALLRERAFGEPRLLWRATAQDPRRSLSTKEFPTYFQLAFPEPKIRFAHYYDSGANEGSPYAEEMLQNGLFDDSAYARII